MTCGSEVLYPSFSGNNEFKPHIALLGDSDGTDPINTMLVSEGYIVTLIPKSSESVKTLAALEPQHTILSGAEDMDITLMRNCLALGIGVVIVARENSKTLKREAISAGCSYFQHTITAEQIRKVCQDLPPTHRLRGTPASRKRATGQSQPALQGNSAIMREVNKQVARVAPTKASVLITGESGTGKEVAAELIHRLSRRREQPFLPVNCGAIPAQLTESEFFGYTKGSFTGAMRDHCGYFERAHKGTLFLDEITEMPIDLQVKLLRVLETQRFFRLGSTQERKVDIRIIAATNRDPDAAVEEGLLRQDLLYRIRIFPVHLPSLRHRKDDIKQFAHHFLSELNAEEGTTKLFSESALNALLGYGWPGNIRELKNAVYRAFIMSDRVIKAESLPTEVNQNAPSPSRLPQKFQVGKTLEEVDRELIFATLDYCKGRRDETAVMLGVSVKTLYNRLRKYQKQDSRTPSRRSSFTDPNRKIEIGRT